MSKDIETIQSSVSCACSSLGNQAIVDMSPEMHTVFSSFQKERKHGLPFWWLSAYECNQCRQWWLVAQEERQNDILIMRRLSQKEADRLLTHNEWPEDFNRYETLLRIGAEAGKRATFLDPLHSSLMRTLSDLAREHPGITVAEIAYLLNLSEDSAGELARIAVRRDNVDISFE